MKTIILGANAFLVAARNLMLRGELTASQFSEMEARYSRMSKEQQQTTVVLS